MTRRLIIESDSGSLNENIGHTPSKRSIALQSAAISGSKNKRYNHKTYNFHHKLHGVVVCTKYELAKRYNRLPSGVSHICHGRRGKAATHKGWKIVEAEASP